MKYDYSDLGEDISNQKYDYSDLSIPKKESNGGLSFIEKLPRNIAAGLAEMGRETANTPYKVSKLANKAFNNKNSLAAKLGIKPSDIPHFEEQNFGEMFGLPKEQTLSDKLIRGAFQYLPGMILPAANIGKAGAALGAIPGAGKFLKRTAEIGFPQAAFGATQTENPLHGAAEGFAVGGLGAGIEGGINALRPSRIFRGNLSPEQLARNLEATKGTETGLGDVIGSPQLKKQYENTLTAIPFSGASEALQRTGKKVQERGEKLLSDMLGKNSPENVPVKLTQDLLEAFKKHDLSKREIYKNVDKLANESNLKLSLPTFSQEAKKYLEAIESTNMLKHDPDAKALISKLINYQNPVSHGKEFLNENAIISRKIKNPTLSEANILKGKLSSQAKSFKNSPDPSQRGIGAVLGKLSSSLKKDIESSIGSHGNEELKSAYKAAEENYAKNFSKFLDKDIYKFTSGSADPETLISKFIQTSNSKDLSGKIHKIAQVLPSKESKDLLSYGYFSRALDNDGNLNPSKLGTAIHKLGKNQFKALVPDSSFREKLMNFSRLSHMNKEAQDLMFNPKTGQRNISPAVAALTAHLAGGVYGQHEGGTAGGIAGLIAPSIIGKVAVKALTSEKLRKALVKAMIENKNKEIVRPLPGITTMELNQYKGEE